MQRVNITTAKAQLSSLLKEVEDSKQEIIIERAGIPIAKIIKYSKPKNFSRVGSMTGTIEIAEDFDKWPSDIEKAFGISE